MCHRLSRIIWHLWLKWRSYLCYRILGTCLKMLSVLSRFLIDIVQLSLIFVIFIHCRYVAICKPFLSHTMSKLSRAYKLILIIWLVSVCLAIPQVRNFKFYEKKNFRLTFYWIFFPDTFHITPESLRGVPNVCP